MVPHYLDISFHVLDNRYVSERRLTAFFSLSRAVHSHLALASARGSKPVPVQDVPVYLVGGMLE